MTYSIGSGTQSPQQGIRRDGLRIAVGVVQVVVSALAGSAWFLCGLGVAMCTDAGPSARCQQLTDLWFATGVTLALSLAAGIGLVTTSLSSAGSRSRAAANWVSSCAAAALVVVGWIFLSVAVGPIGS